MDICCLVFNKHSQLHVYTIKTLMDAVMRSDIFSYWLSIVLVAYWLRLLRPPFVFRSSDLLSGLTTKPRSLTTFLFLMCFCAASSEGENLQCSFKVAISFGSLCTPISGRFSVLPPGSFVDNQPLFLTLSLSSHGQLTAHRKTRTTRSRDGAKVCDPFRRLLSLVLLSSCATLCPADFEVGNPSM